MVRIVVTPEMLDELSQNLSIASAQLSEINATLGRALGSLDWEARQQSEIEGRVSVARQQAGILSERAEMMARFITERAQAFREADAQGAQAIGAVAKDFISAARGFFPQAHLIMGYLLAGRTNMQKFLDLFKIHRYGPMAHWLKIGVLDQRFKMVKALRGVGVGVGIVGDILTADQIDEEVLSVAVIRNVGEYALGAAVPAVGAILAGNALIQLGGAGIVAASRMATPLLATSSEMANNLNTSADRLERAFQRVDLGRITKGISELVYDVTLKPRFDAIKAAWEEPNITNLRQLFMALNPMTPFLTPQSAQETLKDAGKLARDIFDFAMGLPDLALSLVSHSSAITGAAVAKGATILPLPEGWKNTITQSCEVIVDWTVSHPLTVEGAWEFTTTAVSDLAAVRGATFSWENSLQFTPVVQSV